MESSSFIQTDLLPSHGVVICKIHQYCILPSSVASHLSSHHSDHTSTNERLEIQEGIDKLRDKLHQRHEDIVVPLEPCLPIQGLKIHRESLKCKHCSSILTGKSVIESMKKHLRKHLIFANNTGALGDEETQTGWSSHWTVINCQQFFTRMPGQNTNALSYFEVVEPAIDSSQSSKPNSSSEPNTHIDRPVDNLDIDPRLTKIDKLRAQYHRAVEQVAQKTITSRAIVPSAGARQTNPYVEYTKFQKILEGMTWQAIRGYTGVSGDPRLDHLKGTVKSTILAYQYTVANTSRWARIRIMQENWQDIPTTPLVHYQAFDLRHGGALVKIFEFFYQVFTQGMERPKTLNVTKRQMSAWNAIETHLQGLEYPQPHVDLKHTRSTLTILERLCHGFWLSLIQQTAQTNDFELALVTVLAFLAIDSKKDQFQVAYNFATELSAVKKLARFAGCQHFCDIATSFDADLYKQEAAGEKAECEEDIQPHEASEVIDEQNAAKHRTDNQEDNNRSINKIFRQWVYNYLTTEYSTPIGWVIGTVRYISKFRYGETLDAFVRWNGSNVTVRHITTSFEKYKAMVWALYHQTKQVLAELAMVEHSNNLPKIPWDKIYDNPDDRTTGYTPFSPDQPGLHCGKDFVMNQIIDALTKEQRRHLSIDNFGNYDQVKRYGDQVKHFLDLLFLLVHFTSGQPGRLTEILSVQIENSISDGPRNIFLFEGLVAIVPRYHKGYNRDKSLKIIYRFLPHEVGSLLVWYLWLIRPFFQALTHDLSTTTQIPQHRRASSEFLWPDNDGNQFKNSNHFANFMKHITEVHLGEGIIPSLMRHLLVAFGRRIGEPSSSVHALTPSEVDEILETEESDTRDLQAGHMPNTAKAVYALETGVMFRARASEPQAYFKASSKWHWSLGFDPIGDPQDVIDRREATRALLAERVVKRGDINVSRLLQENFGKSVKFRGKQGEVIKSIIQGEPVVSWIAGTGSGKSMSFLLPACCPDYGQTIVITPLVALRTDLTDKCADLSITTSRFGAENFDETARIILAMPENLNDTSFISLVDRLRDSGQVERIVIDEFHYVLLPNHEYRRALLNIRDVSRFATPITLLSATVPVEEEEEAYRLLGLHGKVETFRESTSRPNIKYEIETLPKKPSVTVEDMADYVRKQRKRFGKILVYVAKAETAKQLSGLLECDAYHGGLADEDRARIQKHFKQAKSGILVATTAFNAGVDVPNIEFVVRFGAPDHPITWSQESGRAGRDGSPCVARIVLGRGIPSFIEKLDARPRAVVRELLLENVDTQKCIRATMCNYFDGATSRIHCRSGEQTCSYCDRLTGTSSYSVSTPIRPPMTPAPVLGYLKDDVFTPLGPSQSTPRRTSPTDAYMHSSPPNLPAHPKTRSSQWLDNSSSPCLSRVPITSSNKFSDDNIRKSSPLKRYHEQEVPPSPPSDSPSQIRTIKAARIDRQLGYNRERWHDREKSGARIMDQLKATGELWLSQCAYCFATGKAFNHAKQTCTNFTGALVSEYRGTRMQNQIGHPMCFTCCMPMSLCQRWIEDGTRKVSRTYRRDVNCTYPRAILDTWACLWEHCSKMKQVWLERIREESDGRLDGNNPADFRTYFQTMVEVGSEKPIGRIAYDVNWLSQKYFQSGKDKWQELL